MYERLRLISVIRTDRVLRDLSRVLAGRFEIRPTTELSTLSQTCRSTGQQVDVAFEMNQPSQQVLDALASLNSDGLSTFRVGIVQPAQMSDALRWVRDGLLDLVVQQPITAQQLGPLLRRAETARHRLAS